MKPWDEKFNADDGLVTKFEVLEIWGRDKSVRWSRCRASGTSPRPNHNGDASLGNLHPKTAWPPCEARKLILNLQLIGRERLKLSNSKWNYDKIRRRRTFQSWLFLVYENQGCRPFVRGCQEVSCEKKSIIDQIHITNNRDVRNCWLSTIEV